MSVKTGIRFAAAAATLWCAACASNGPPSTFEELGPDANTRGFGDLYPTDPNTTDFTFGVGDTALVDVPDEPLFSGAFAVRLDGKINIKVIGDLIVAGLTTDQLKRKLENKLSLYLKNPAVTVGVGNIVSKKYYVAAQNPATGGYLVRQTPYKGDTTLFDVWAQMGSPSTLLDDECNVTVVRGDPRSPVILKVNVREILVAGYTGGNIQIRPNDIVYVPPTFWGRLNEFFTGLSLPFNGLLRVSATVVSTDRAIRIISGDSGTNFGYYGP